jgi:hypothetical protein
MFSPAMPFNLGCWGFTFPLGVQSLATPAFCACNSARSLLGLAAVWPIAAVLIIVVVGTERFRDDWSGTGPLPKPDSGNIGLLLTYQSLSFCKAQLSRPAKRELTALRDTTCAIEPCTYENDNLSQVSRGTSSLKISSRRASS